MRLLLILVLGATFIMGGAGRAAYAVDALVEPFDDDSQFTVSEAFFSDGGFDFFGIADGAGGGDFGGDPAPSGLKAYTGFTGGFLTGMDLNGEGATIPISATWAGIDISGLTSLEFSGDFAEFFDAPGDIDFDDFLRVSASIDGGGFVPILEFRITPAPDNFNEQFGQDTDFDGVGEGTVLTGMAQNFSVSIPGTGSVLDLLFEARVEAGDEDFGADNFVVSGEPGPTPFSCVSPPLWWTYGDAVKFVFTPFDEDASLTATIYVDDVPVSSPNDPDVDPDDPAMFGFDLVFPNITPVQSGAVHVVVDGVHQSGASPGAGLLTVKKGQTVDSRAVGHLKCNNN